ANGRPLQGEGLDLPLGSVPLDLTPAVRSPEILLVDVLDPGASDVVVGEIAAVFELRQLLFGDRARVPDHRRVEGPIDVEANALGVDPHAREELGALRDRQGDLARHRGLRDSYRLVRIAD